MEDESYISFLELARYELIMRANNLIEQKKSLDILISQYYENINNEKKILEKKSLTTTGLIKRLFSLSPNKKWIAPKIRDEFVKLLKDNIIQSTTENPLNMVHNILKTLVEQKFIIKEGREYYLNKNYEG